MEHRMQGRVYVLIVALLIGEFACASAAKCGKCLGNGVACYNETSFYMCHDNTNPDTSQIINCSTDEVCTGLSIVCAPSDQVTPVCGDTSGCGDCSVGGFTCISRSMFTLCPVTEPNTMTIKCPDGYVCDSSSATAEICVRECKAEISCDKPDVV